VKPQTGRAHARRLLPVIGVCAECERAPATERHHWDGDAGNNDRNVVPVCRRCHMRLDGRLDAALATLPVGWMRNLTECKRGHPFTPENTYINAKGDRICRTCKREYERAAYRAGRRR
jgi:hypothetical protein